MKKHLHILYVLNKITLTTENRFTVLHNLFLLDMSIFNDLVIKNYPVKKATSSFVFMEGVQLPHDKVLVLEYRTFHCNCNSKFTILVNFNLVLLTPSKI